jgi:hypothetical protein
MNDSKQINVRLTPETLRQIQMEAMFANVTQQDFASRVFEHFLTLPKDKTSLQTIEYNFIHFYTKK